MSNRRRLSPTEAAVFLLILILLLVWVVLAVLLTAWSMWFQGFLYTEPSGGLVWRAPAAASAIMAVVFLWVIVDYRTQGRYRPIWETTSTEASQSFPELRVPDDATGKEDVYKLRPGSRNEYRLGGLPSGKPMPATPPQVIAGDDDNRATFKPELDAKGNYLRRKTRGAEEPLRYVDAKGRVMREGELGRVESFRTGTFLGNLLMNLVFLVACFLSLWLLARFQWLHALGQAAALALLMMLFVLPPVLSKAESVAAQRAAPK